MSSSRYRSLSFVALLLTTACVDADGGPDRPDLVAPSEDEIVQEEEPEEEPAKIEPAKIEPDEVGLPCDVKEFLAKHCQGCHGAQAKNGTALLTYENLLGPSKKQPDANVATRALVRMMDTAKPMPPAAKMERPSEAELAMFVAWIEADMPAGRCDE